MLKNLINKYLQLNSAARAALWYIACNLIQKGITFIVIPIYSRLLTTAEYGSYMVFQSWREIIIVFATLNLYAGVFTKAMVDYKEDRDRYSSCMQGLSTVLTAGLFMLFVLMPSYWSKTLEMERTSICLMFLYFLTFPSFSFWSVRQRVEYKYRSLVIVTVISSLLIPGVSLALLRFTNLRANAVIWGYLIPQIVLGAFFYVSIFLKGKTFFVREYWLFALKYNIPLIPHYLSVVMLGQIDRVMIGNIRGMSEAGIYALAYQLSSAMNVIISGVNSSLVPWFYEHLRDKSYQRIRQVVGNLCIIVGAGVLFFMLVGPEIISIMGPSEYSNAKWVIPAVTVSTFITFVYGLYSCIEFYYAKTFYVTIASACGAASNIIMNLALIPRFGFIAAGYTTLVSYFLLLILHYCFSISICRHNDVPESTFPTALISLILVLLVLAVFLCQLLYRIGMLRYILVIALATAALYHRAAILQTIKGFRNS